MNIILLRQIGKIKILEKLVLHQLFELKQRMPVEIIIVFMN